MSNPQLESLETVKAEPLLKRNWILFWSYIKITSLVVGGGYAIIAASQKEFVYRRKWLTDDDVVEMISIIQTVPGILACNSAIYIGWRVGGISGALCALAGSVIPSLIIIMLIAAGVDSVRQVIESPAVQGAFTGVIAGIVGMVICTALKLQQKSVKTFFDWGIAFGCFIGLTIFKINTIWLILAAILAGLLKVGFCSDTKQVKEEKTLK